MIPTYLLRILTVISIITSAKAQLTEVRINPRCQKFLGDVSTLNRDVYFNIHNSSDDSDMNQLMSKYNVNKGRMFWGPFAEAKNKTKQVGKYPFSKKGKIKSAFKVIQNIATAHPRDAFVNGMDTKKAAKWAVEYYMYHVNERPAFFEPMNEPFVHAKDFYTGGWDPLKQVQIKKQMAQLFAECGKAFHKTPALSNIKVVGYSSAWPSMELNNFDHWNENMKMFMDTAGEHMDAFATHLYDGINVAGQDNIRSGSNAEAILDLIEAYSFIKWKKIKPHAITEYGAIEEGYAPEYSDAKSIQTVRSINHILFSLLDREDRMLISIPFITGKATWHINEKNNYEPYQAVLWRPLTIEKTSNPNKPLLSDWKFTARIHFYDLWKEVKGKRVDIESSNPDIQTQAFLNNKTLYVALSNIDDKNQKIALQLEPLGTKVKKVTKKALKIYDNDAPVFTKEKLEEAPKEITLIPHETVILAYELASNISFTSIKKVVNTYSNTYLKDIEANIPNDFAFTNVPVGEGSAVLKMGIGRKHDRSKKPKISINGTEVEVPNNWKGYDQVARDDFFGVIEIPFETALLEKETNVSIVFPDDVGKISSLILQTTLSE
ncbi:hypothetical protein [Aquimarina agarilytica]|uniref:hypothetical protein n=1 Tax=Aquimarina agarilytica TaxID=1087449 RepID=UPI000289C3DE|nr:hypothetical protein [Aquimarina agarilytica]